MKIALSIACDNAAFDPPGPEVARILTKLADKARELYGADEFGYSLDGDVLFDFNGNRVGSVTVTK